MENNVQDLRRAAWDDKRFPKTWLAMTGCALMQPAVLVLMTIVLFVGRLVSQEFFLRATSSTTNFGGMMMNYVFSQFLALLFVVLFLLTVSRKDLLTTCRLKKGLDGMQILFLLLLCLGGFFLAQSLNGIFLQLISRVIGEPVEPDTPDANSLSQLLFELVIVGGLPAVCEELFYRGMVMRAYERVSRKTAVLLSAVTFAIMHGTLQQQMYAFSVGILLALVTMKSDSLFAGSLVHFTFNTFSVILTYPPVYAWYERAAENPVFSLVLTAVTPALFAGGFLGFWLYTSRKNRRLYGSATVSDMAFPHLMPKQKGWRAALFWAAWGVFLLINVYSMGVSWFRGIG